MLLGTLHFDGINLIWANSLLAKYNLTIPQNFSDFLLANKQKISKKTAASQIINFVHFFCRFQFHPA